MKKLIDLVTNNVKLSRCKGLRSSNNIFHRFRFNCGGESDTIRFYALRNRSLSITQEDLEYEMMYANGCNTMISDFKPLVTMKLSKRYKGGIT